MKVLTIPVILGAVLVACSSKQIDERTAGRYSVTTTPLDVGIGPVGICVAVQPGIANGVWWWSPGRTGCSTRSTGPGLFRPDGASVSAGEGGATEVRFRLQQIVAPQSRLPEIVDVHLTLSDGYLSMPASGKRVPVERRDRLDVPEGV